MVFFTLGEQVRGLDDQVEQVRHGRDGWQETAAAAAGQEGEGEQRARRKQHEQRQQQRGSNGRGDFEVSWMKELSKRVKTLK